MENYHLKKISRIERERAKKKSDTKNYKRNFGSVSTVWERANLVGIIYRILNLANGKSYIGQTINWFDNRYGGGRWWELTENILLERTVNYHGLDKFEVQILEFGIETIKELNTLEIKYIAEFKTFIEDGNGYNLDRGGNNKSCSEKQRNSISKANTGKKRTLEQIAKMTSVNKKPVNQINKNTGELIKTWPSAADASKNLSICAQNIYAVCTGKVKLAGDFSWTYADIVKAALYSPKQLAKRGVKNKIPINQIDKQTGIIIKTWPSAVDAGENLRIDSSSISKACRGKSKSAGGFCWVLA